MDIESARKKDEEIMNALSEEKEESWKWILKVVIAQNGVIAWLTKKRKNPENGYWKLAFFIVVTGSLILKKRKNPENGYWKNDTSWVAPELFRKEEKEESWKWILKDC